MGDIEFEVDWDSIEITVEKIKERVHDGAEKGLDDALSVGQEAAVERILQRRTPYTTPHLHSSFDHHQFDLGDEIQGHITNPLDYAAYVDQGVSGTERSRDTPFAYTDSMPPIEEMIEYVEERMGGWDLDSDGGGAPFDSDNDDGDSGDSEGPTTPLEEEKYVKSWEVGDVLYEPSTDKTYDIKERDEDSWIITDGESSESVSFDEAADRFDHSLLDGNDIDLALRQQETFANLKRNFANGRDWKFSDETLDTLSDGDVVEFNLERGDVAYGTVLPEEAQDGDYSTISVEVFALKPASGELEGKIVNNADYKYGIEPFGDVGNPTRFWKSDNLKSRPYLEGTATIEEIENRDGTINARHTKYENQDIDVDNIEKGDEVVIKKDNESEFRRVVNEVREDEIIFNNSDGYDKRFDADNNFEIVAYTRNFTTFDQVEEGDDVLLNGNKLNDTNEFNGQIILATVDEIHYPNDSKRTIEFSRYYGQKQFTATLDGDTYIYSRKDKPGIWSYKSLDEGLQDPKVEITFEQTIESTGNFTKANILRDGYLVKKTEKGDIYDDGGQATVRYYNESGDLKEETISQRQLVEIRDKVEIPDNVNAILPDSKEDVSWTTLDKSGFDNSQVDKGDVVLVWDKVAEELNEGVVDRDRSRYTSVQLSDEFLNRESLRVEYDSVGSVDSESTHAIVGKVTSGFGTEIDLPTNSEDRPEIFYGQEIKFDYKGEEYDAYVTDWEDKYLDVEGTDVVDKVPLKATFDAQNSARLKSYESWSGLTETQKIEQMKDEIRYKKEFEYNNPQYVENFASKFGEELNRSFKYNEDLRNMVARIDLFSQFYKQGGVMSSRGSLDNGFRLQISDAGSGGSLSDVTHSTFHHEWEHAFHISKGYSRGRGSDAGNFSQGYPEIDFNEDGTTGPNAGHAELEELVFRNKRENKPPSELSDVDFTNIEFKSGYFKDFNPESIDDSEFESIPDFDSFKEKSSEKDIVKFTKDQILGGKTEHLGVVEDASSEDNTITIFSLTKGKKMEIYNFRMEDMELYESDDSIELIEHENRFDNSWSPSRQDRFERYAEATNRSLKRRLWAANDGGKIQELTEINRSYHTANAAESTTGMAEIFQSEKYDKAHQIVQVYRAHPAYVETYLDNHTPSPTARKIIQADPALSELEDKI